MAQGRFQLWRFLRAFNGYFNPFIIAQAVGNMGLHPAGNLNFLPLRQPRHCFFDFSNCAHAVIFNQFV